MGIAQKDGTILDWHMIEPLPEKAVESKLNDKYLDYLETPSTLHFKPLPISDWFHPEKAWIQELKGEQCK